MAKLARKLKRGERLELPGGVTVTRDRGQVVVVINTELAKPEDVEAFVAAAGSPSHAISKIDNSSRDS